MFDINNINKRYFEININVEDEEGKTYSAHLEIEPPKIKTVKKLMTIAETAGDEEKKGTEVVEDLQEAMRIILNKNKTKYKVPDELIENLDVDQMKGILAEFFDWLGGERKAKN